jgi:hypothetical protein
MKDPTWETTKAKTGWGVAQVAEHTPSKHEALSSNAGTAQKITKNKVLNKNQHTSF